MENGLTTNSMAADSSSSKTGPTIKARSETAAQVEKEGISTTTDASTKETYIITKLVGKEPT